MTAHAVIEVSEPHDTPWGLTVSVVARCSECKAVTFTGGKPDRDWSGLLDDHLRQHAPGRALDIEVDWEPTGYCSVCEDGIGDIGRDADGEGLICKDCGTTWDIEGRSGERVEDQ